MLEFRLLPRLHYVAQLESMKVEMLHTELTRRYFLEFSEERARRQGLEDVRSVAQTQEVTQLKAEIARLNERLKVVSGT